MIKSLPRLVLLLLLGAGVAGAAGCQTGRVKDERDALWKQNQELQNELARTRSALEASESDRNGLAEELSRLQDQASQAVAPVAAAPAPAAGSGFSQIAGVETVRSAGAIAVRVPGDVLFESGKSDLKQSARRTLSQIAAVIKREYPNQVVRIEGYTDTDPIRRSKWTDNLELSLARSAAVYRHLVSEGVSPRQMYASGFGEHRPRSTKAQSRRVEIVVLTQ